MALLSILKYPDARLHKVAARVEKFDDSLKKLVRDMAETMYEAPGIGLAATQVDVHRQVIVIDTTDRRGEPPSAASDTLQVFINPEILRMEGLQKCEEGCLSVPGIYEDVERADKIWVRTFNDSGEERLVEADGLLSQCIQHEMDHLKGRVFVDRLSRLKQMRIKARADKELKAEREYHARQATRGARI